jgi:hypothetical protein
MISTTKVKPGELGNWRKNKTKIGTFGIAITISQLTGRFPGGWI